MSTYKVKGVESANILTSSAGGPTKTRIPFLRTAGMDVPQTTIDFMGDNQVQSLYSIDKIIASVEADKVDTAVWQKLYNKTSLPGAGEVSRHYFGGIDEETAPEVGLELNLAAVDDTLGTSHTLQITIFRGRAMPYKLPNTATKEKHGMAFTFEGIKTSTTVQASSISPALPANMAGGIYYSIAVLSSV